MDNKKRLEEILKIRELRNNLNNLSISMEEKEILRRSFNYYENLLNLDIVKTNLNKEELDNYEIENDLERLSVPIEYSLNKYFEYVKVLDNAIIEIINKLNCNLETLNLNNKDKKVILNSIKEYSLYIKQVNQMKKSNQELYKEIMETKIK